MEAKARSKSDLSQVGLGATEGELFMTFGLPPSYSYISVVVTFLLGNKARSNLST
jgi:hypothetical protein